MKHQGRRVIYRTVSLPMILSDLSGYCKPG